MSESATSRAELSPYCIDPCIDIGFGGTAVHDRATTFDMVQPYCPSLEGHPQMLRGDARRLPFVCDEAFASIHSSHLLEDFSYDSLREILKEWRRILRTNGNLCLNCPDQKRFVEHCQRTGQGLNLAHCEPDFSLATFRKVLHQTGKWEEIFVKENHPPYSWLLVAKKV